MPEGHAEATPPWQTSPAGHGSHAPLTLCVPSGHVPAAAHSTEFAAALDVPLAHAVHFWSADAEPAVPTYVPGAQRLHAAHEVAF